MSGAQLDSLRKIPWRFQLNPSSRLGGVVVTRFFSWLTDLVSHRNFCQLNQPSCLGGVVVVRFLWLTILLTGGICRLALLVKIKKLRRFCYLKLLMHALTLLKTATTCVKFLCKFPYLITQTRDKSPITLHCKGKNLATTQLIT